MNGYKKDYKLEEKFHEFRDLRELLKASAEKYGDKTAFVTKVKVDGNTTYINTSYEEVFNSVNKLGTAMLNMGFGDARVAVIGENSWHWLLSYFAAACSAGVAVPLDKLLQEEEIKGLLIRSSAKIIFCDKKHYKVIKNIMDSGETSLEYLVGLDFVPDKGTDIVSLLENGETLLAANDKRYIEHEIDPNIMSFLLFTSGTTQASKAVMLSHKNLMSCNYQMNLEELFFEDDVNMMILPLHHIYGMSGLLTFLTQGMKTVFCDGLKYIVANIKEYKVSVMMTVPLLLENIYKKINKAIADKGMTEKVAKAKKLCNLADKIGINLRPRLFKAIHEQLGGNMRFLINGAAALDPVVSRGLNEFGILTVQGYGLTETSPTISSETYRYLKPGSVGKLMPYLEAKIDEPNDEGIGELMVKGDVVMLGYYDDAAATDEVIENGWFHTGDLAYFDNDGYLWITGRKKNVIVMKNGKNVFPEEIENLVNNLPYISESMVFSKNKQTDIVLWIKAVYDSAYLRENKIMPEDLEKKFAEDLDEINRAMPAYKMIKHFLLSDIPTIKTTTQKTKRRDEMVQIDKELKEKGLI